MNDNARRKGSYILTVGVKKDKEIEIGKLGVLPFKEGYYAYVGSAMNGLDARIGRHIRQNKKKHWHIDYLLEEGVIRQIWCMEGGKNECEIASVMEKKFGGVKNFGSSDCSCGTHLFHSKNLKRMVDVIKGIGMVKYEGKSSV
ncbi:MAG: GIY-YIG nuclease family protein [Candidatus Thermoplasmatota archaeon]|nr:GIY-YIG nuclease family protein [Candidatus Thermoplasmatota archaeon]